MTQFVEQHFLISLLLNYSPNSEQMVRGICRQMQLITRVQPFTLNSSNNNNNTTINNSSNWPTINAHHRSVRRPILLQRSTAVAAVDQPLIRFRPRTNHLQTHSLAVSAAAYTYNKTRDTIIILLLLSQFIRHIITQRARLCLCFASLILSTFFVRLFFFIILYFNLILSFFSFCARVVCPKEMSSPFIP